MQVNSTNTSLQQRYFSKTSSIGGVRLPNFNDNYVFSKQESGISDDEYKMKIVDQAHKDFAAGKFQNQSQGFNALMKKYTAEVSPDRKRLITSGLKAVSKNNNVTKPVNLIEILLGGKVKYQKLPSTESEYIEFFDGNGEMVATYSNTGWTMYTTNAEAARQTDMCMTYNAAWRDAKNGANAPAVVGNPAVADGCETTIDKMA